MDKNKTLVSQEDWTGRTCVVTQEFTARMVLVHRCPYTGGTELTMPEELEFELIDRMHDNAYFCKFDREFFQKVIKIAKASEDTRLAERICGIYPYVTIEQINSFCRLKGGKKDESVNG